MISDTHSRRASACIDRACLSFVAVSSVTLHLAVDVAGRPPCRHIRMHQLRCAARNPARASTLLPHIHLPFDYFSSTSQPSALLKRTLHPYPRICLPDPERHQLALPWPKGHLTQVSPDRLPRRAGLGAHSSHQISSMRLSSGESGSFPPIVRVRLTL
jgi:hypothetical protein